MKWMRLLPLLAAVLGVVVSFAQRAPVEPPRIPQSESLNFSHRSHLTRAKASCEDCHTSAATSTAASDNNLPLEKTCLKCHDGAKARKECTVCHTDPKNAPRFQLSPRDFRFNHQQHMKLGNVAPVIAGAIDSGKYLSKPENIRKHLNTDNPCVACHRGLEETDFSTPANLPQMADCLVCHTEIDPPFSCEFCHTKEAKIKPASHTPDYIDLHSSKRVTLDKQSCTICHGTNFRCMGCH